MNIPEKFLQECKKEVAEQGKDTVFQKLSREWMDHAAQHKYSYHFTWLGRPIIQYPQDILAMQELIWRVRPDLIIETGIAHGGSLILYASLLELVAQCGGPAHGHVLGIDIDIRSHNKMALEKHPMNKRITMIEGSSIDSSVIKKVHNFASQYKTIMLLLDSNHTHKHVAAELEAYAVLVTPGSYCVVFDTVIEAMPEDSFPDRPWDRGNNPFTAVQEFLATHQEFIEDRDIDNKLLISVSSHGYLRRKS